MKTAIVDRREPPRRIEQYQYEGFEVEVPADLLESGDVVLVIDGKQIGIEIKTTSEILGLIPSGLSQLAQFQRMATFDIRVLLVVGTFGSQRGQVLLDGWSSRSGLSYASVQGALFNLQANLGFLVRHCENEASVGRAVHNIHSYFSVANHILLSKPRPLTLSSSMSGGLAVLMTLPGIGSDKASAILEQFGTLDAAFQNIVQWTNVPGIGPKTAAAATAFMTKEWK